MSDPRISDVIIVGAGISGLIAANELVKQGLRVQILEASDRIGGRIYDFRSQHGYTFPLGATWFGPDEEKLHALMAELGLVAEPQYEAGKIVTHLQGQKRTVENNEDVRVGPVPLPSGILPDDFLEAIHSLDRLCLEVPLDNPHNHPRAAEWNNLSVAEWVNQQTTSNLGATLFRLIIEGALWTEMEEISFLFLLYHWHALETYMVDDRRVKGGPRQIIDWLAEQLDGRIQLQSPVTAILQDADYATMRTPKGTFTGRYAIVAIPPPLCAKINFDPPLPPARMHLSQQMRMGKVMKVIITYETPFWREDGLSGMMLHDEGPLDACFDTSPDSSAHGALMSFLSGRMLQIWRNRPQAERRNAIIAQLTDMFGPKAGAPLEYIEQDWMSEPWSGGCYCGIMPPKSLPHYADALRTPFGRIHWAGTETATKWYGSMEGAIASGEREARAVLDRMANE